MRAIWISFVLLLAISHGSFAQETRCVATDIDKSIEALMAFNPACTTVLEDYAQKVNAIHSCDETNPYCYNMSQRYMGCAQGLSRCESELDVYIKSGGNPVDLGTVLVATTIGCLVVWYFSRKHYLYKGEQKSPKEEMYGEQFPEYVEQAHFPLFKKARMRIKDMMKKKEPK